MMGASREFRAASSRSTAVPESLARRRRRVWRSIIVIAAVTSIMVVLSMAERDNQSLRGSIEKCRRDLEFAASHLQEALDRGAAAPTRLPLPQDPGEEHPALRHDSDEDAQLDRLLHYEYDPLHRKAVRPGRAVIICYCAKPHVLYLQDDRRHVILFDGKKYWVESLTEPQFRRRASELTIPLR